MLLKCHARDSVDGDEDDAAAAAKHNAANHSGNERAYYDTYRIGCTSVRGSKPSGGDTGRSKSYSHSTRQRKFETASGIEHETYL